MHRHSFHKCHQGHNKVLDYKPTERANISPYQREHKFHQKISWQQYCDSFASFNFLLFFGCNKCKTHQYPSHKMPPKLKTSNSHDATCFFFFSFFGSLSPLLSYKRQPICNTSIYSKGYDASLGGT